MLRALLNDVLRKGLWPIPAVALLIAVAAPLFFLKSAGEAPSAAPAPPVAERLPARAEKLLAGSEPGAGAPRAAQARDPFEPPRAHRPAKKAAAATPERDAAPPAASSPAPAPGTDANPVKVVIAGSGPATVSPTTTTRSGSSGAGTRATTGRRTAAAVPRTAQVDVRFGKTSRARVRRAVSRLQPFVARGGVLAQFVKYSPARRKAVFAVAPGVKVGGAARCRRKAGVCRYVDVRAGSAVRLIIRHTDGSLLRRHLGVVRIRRGSGTRAEVARARRTAAHGGCLLERLLAQDLSGPPVGAAACG
jgi:hypothetical protein